VTLPRPLQDHGSCTGRHPRGEIYVWVQGSFVPKRQRDQGPLAFWFAGLNSFLDDERPQDVLATDPESAIAAAKDEMAELHHG
jgi:hypothetical protein